MRFLYKSTCDTLADNSNLLGDGPGDDDDDDGGSDGVGDVDSGGEGDYVGGDGGCDGGDGGSTGGSGDDSVGVVLLVVW